MPDQTYVPCPHCGHPYPMTPMQKDLYRGRTLACNNCAKMIINAGIKRVIYEGDYPDEFSKELFRDGKIEVLRLVGDRLEVVDLETCSV